MIRLYRELVRNAHPLVDNSMVDLYTSAAWPYNGRVSKRLPEDRTPRPAISLIATVRNEGENVEVWLNSLLAQVHPPDEIVLVDGGSTDGTFEAIQRFGAQSPVPLTAIQEPGANIARGRNTAIERAAGPIIACTDAGCVVPPEWLAAISGPFAVDPAMEVAAGYYEVIQQNDLQRVMAMYFVCPPHEVDAQNFLPSGRSLAFRKEVWSRVGGFPEWLTLTAEDTLFGLALKRQANRWAFVPEAVVRWHPKSTICQLFRQVRRYGRGDGEAGLFPHKYLGLMRLYGGLLLAGLLTVACLVLALVTRMWPLLLVALVPAIWAARRLWQTTLQPSWPRTLGQEVKAWVLSLIVKGTISLALAIGFVEGVWSRREK